MPIIEYDAYKQKLGAIGPRLEKLAAALDAAAEQAKTLTKESGGRNTGLQTDEAARALLKETGGKEFSEGNRW